VPEGQYIYSRSSLVWAIKGRPHPNAGKVFINWILGKDGGTSWSKEILENSRRFDVPVFNPDVEPVAGVKYVPIQAEDMLPKTEESQKLIKDLLG
jgi:ABC-type Fe3+ transport system substrate-binding protein